MKAYSPYGGVDCYIAVPPQYRPQLFTGIDHIGEGNLRCYPRHSVRANDNRIPLSDGTFDIYRLGDDRHDVTLELTAASDETM